MSICDDIWGEIYYLLDSNDIFKLSQCHSYGRKRIDKIKKLIYDEYKIPSREFMYKDGKKTMMSFNHFWNYPKLSKLHKYDYSIHNLDLYFMPQWNFQYDFVIDQIVFGDNKYHFLHTAYERAVQRLFEERVQENFSCNKCIKLCTCNDLYMVYFTRKRRKISFMKICHNCQYDNNDICYNNNNIYEKIFI